MNKDDQATRLRKIAVSITGKISLILTIDKDAQCSCTDYTNIIVAPKMIPKGITDPDTRNVLMEGTTIHESGHIRWTESLKEYYNDWMMGKDNVDLAKNLYGVLEDCRIDKLAMDRWRLDYGPRRKLFLDILGVSLQKAFLKDKESKLTDIFNSWMCHSKYGFDVSKRFNKKHKKLLKNMYDLTEIAKRTGRIRASRQLRRKAPGLLDILDDMYEMLINEFPEKPMEEQKIPSCEGGQRVITGKNPKKAKDKAKAGKKSGKGEKKEEGSSVGKGTGLLIPAPLPDKQEYNRLVVKNEPIIQQMLRRLKNEQTTRVVNKRFRPHGRLMTELAPQMLTQSIKHEVENPYSRRYIIFEKGRVSLGLLVDLSASVNWEDAMDMLTIISEVGGRWLREEDLAVLAFASDYMKIKVFVEQYWNTAPRLGGLNNYGIGQRGTLMHPSLTEFTKMFASFNTRKKILVVVSDFEIDSSDSYQVKREIKQMENNGVTVIGIGLTPSDIHRVGIHCNNATTINSITELPEKFFEIWHYATKLSLHV